MNPEKMILIGCGILHKEIKFLIQKNQWPVDTFFLNSALHTDFGKLEKSLTSALEKYESRNMIVFYGCCHPLMDKILGKAESIRTEGQNCVDILLGNTLFSRELADGAFFLLEDWALRWDQVITRTFGIKDEIVKEIFQQGGRKYLLCIRTPCSGDFRRKAEEAGKRTDLPVRWTDVSLDHLESALRETLMRKKEDFQW